MVGERIFFGRKTNVSVTNEYLYLRFCDSTIVDKRMDSEIIVWYIIYILVILLERIIFLLIMYVNWIREIEKENILLF